MANTVSGSVPNGFVIGETRYTEFEMREANMEDMFEAETGAGVDTPLAFQAELMARQLVRVSTKDRSDVFEGPFVRAMFNKLKPSDYRALRAKQVELDKLGEGE